MIEFIDTLHIGPEPLKLPVTGEELHTRYREHLRTAGVDSDGWAEADETDRTAWNALALDINRAEGV